MHDGRACISVAHQAVRHVIAGLYKQPHRSCDDRCSTLVDCSLVLVQESARWFTFTGRGVQVADNHSLYHMAFGVIKTGGTHTTCVASLSPSRLVTGTCAPWISASGTACTASCKSHHWSGRIMPTDDAPICGTFNIHYGSKIFCAIWCYGFKLYAISELLYNLSYRYSMHGTVDVRRRD